MEGITTNELTGMSVSQAATKHSIIHPPGSDSFETLRSIGKRTSPQRSRYLRNKLPDARLADNTTPANHVIYMPHLLAFFSTSSSSPKIENLILWIWRNTEHFYIGIT